MILDSFYLTKKNAEKKLAVLLDPDKVDFSTLELSAKTFELAGVGYLFVGGSLLEKDRTEALIRVLKTVCNIPIILFPGSVMQICPQADAILFLSLISGRNPDFLIGQQVIAAPMLESSDLEVIATGYMLIDSGKLTTALYMSGTMPIPANKPEIARCTALAGHYLGLQTFYLDAGSGADNPVPASIIQAVSGIPKPLIVGGGINSPAKANNAAKAGADIIVVGNALENNQYPDYLNSLIQAIHFTS
jgi:putative glycerol-1-phosphate prenyltransferase